jgi:predicted dehydrogenase
VVFIATPDFTHVELAMHWLQPTDRCGQIFIEKPLDSDLDSAKDLLLVIKQNDPKVRTLDHYRARVLPVTTPLQRKHMLKDLGGRIVGFTFYFLEDGSGPPRIGPIENEGRARSLANGLILDMMPHVPAILSYFGLVETIRVTGLKAGRYTYTPKAGAKKVAAIKNETFAHVRFTFFDHRLSAPPMQCDAYVGKGIRGVRGLNMKGNVKLLEIHGQNSNRYRLDLRTSGRHHASSAMLIRKNGQVEELTDLIHSPYEALIRRVVRHELDDPEASLRFDLPVETAISILLSIEQMRHPLKERKKPLPKYYKRKPLPTYHIGRGGEEAPYLEDVLELLEPIIPFE